MVLPGLLNLLRHNGVNVRERVPVVTRNGLGTDVDILAFDPRDKCLLVVQHKWEIERDTPTETLRFDKKLRDGIWQAMVAKEALSDISYAKRLMPDIASTGYDSLEAIVVSKGQEPSGFIAGSDIPVVTELWFRKNASSCAGLKELHDCARSRPDVAELVKQYSMSEKRVKLAGYEFRIPSVTGIAFPTTAAA